MDTAIRWSGYGRELRPPFESLEVPVAHFDLEREIERLHAEEAWRDSGHNGKTLAKHNHLRVVLTVLRADRIIPRHGISGASTIQVLTGRVRLRSGRRRMDVLPGQIVVLAGRAAVEIEAVSDCGFLLTFMA